jgi:hypothetical protein
MTTITTGPDTKAEAMPSADRDQMSSASSPAAASGQATQRRLSGLRTAAGSQARHLGRYSVVGIAAPLIVYAALAPEVRSSTVRLAAAGALSMALTLAMILRSRQLNPALLLNSIGYATGCAASLMIGSSLPLKLHETAITFSIGLTLLVAVAIGRPPPIDRMTRLRAPELNRTLGSIIGCFLVLHASSTSFWH